MAITAVPKMRREVRIQARHLRVGDEVIHGDGHGLIVADIDERAVLDHLRRCRPELVVLLLDPHSARRREAVLQLDEPVWVATGVNGR